MMKLLKTNEVWRLFERNTMLISFSILFHYSVRTRMDNNLDATYIIYYSILVGILYISSTIRLSDYVQTSRLGRREGVMFFDKDNYVQYTKKPDFFCILPTTYLPGL